MANDKKFIVKNGLLTQETVVIGSNTDNGVNKLQVTGSSIFTQSSSATPTISITNTGGTSNSIIAQFVGDSDSLQVLNIGTGDYALVNSQQNNGIRFHDGTAGVEILYNGLVDLDFNSTGIDFKREPSYNGNVFWNAGNDGAGSGLDADLLDGLDSLQFLRSDEDDTFNGNLIITGDLTVQGTTTTINTETILLADNIITLNSNYTGSTPTENAGIEVERGTLTNSSLVWDETSDWWKLISAGTDLGRIITTADEGSGNGFDADSVDGLDSTQFLRSDVDDTAAGNIIIQGTLTVGNNTSAGATITMDGQAGNRYIFSNNGEIGFLNSAFAYAAYSDGSNNWRVLNDTYAKRFIDSDNNTYLLDPASTSVLNTIDLEGQIRHNGDVDTYIHFNAADSFEVRTGGSARLTVTNSAVTATQDVVAPRFVDSNNNSYYADLSGDGSGIGINFNGQALGANGTSSFPTYGFAAARGTGMYRTSADVLVLTTDGINRFGVGAGTNTYNISFLDLRAPRFVDSDNVSKFADPGGTSEFNSANFYSGSANNSVNIGISATERFNIDVTDGQGFIRYIQDETNSTDHSVNFQIVSTSTGLNRFNFNKNIDVGSNSVSGAFGVFSSGVYAPIFYDNDNELYYADFNNTDVSIRVAGEIIAGDGSLATPTFSFDSDVNTGMYRFAADTIGFSAGGNDEFRIYTTYAQAVGQMRAPIFYDSNNTAYYGDFASTSNMNRIDLDDYIRHRGDTDTYFGFSAADTIIGVTANTTRLTINTTALTSTLNTYAPRFYTNDYLVHNGDENTYVGFDANDTFGVWTNGANRLSITNTAITGSVNFVGPRFVDSDNNAYYAEPASASVFNTLGIDSDLFHNGDTDTKLAFSTDSIALNTAGTTRLTANNTGVYVTNLYSSGVVDAVTAAYAPIYYDRDNNNYYADFANTGTSIVTAGKIAVGTTTANAQVDINIPTAVGANPFAVGNRYIRLGDAGVADFTLAGDNTRNIWGIIQASSQFIFADSGATILLSMDAASGDVIVGDQTAQFATSDGTPTFVSALDASKFHVNGSIQLNGINNALSIYAADAANTAINEATFLAVNELGFSAGGGFYMNDTTNIRIRGNKTLISTQDIIAPRFVDGDNTNYFVDPAGDSQMNTIDIDDYIRHRGDTNNYFGFEANDTFRVWTNAVRRLNIDNDSADFSVNVYAPRYYDSDNNAYYVDPASTSIMSRIDIDDYIRHRGDENNYFGFAANDTFRVFTGGAQRLNVDDNSADFAVDVYAPRYFDSNNNSFYGDFAATSVFARVTLPQNTVGVGFASNANVPDYYIGQQTGDNDGWKIFSESPSGTNTGALIIQSEDDYDANESIRLRFKRTASPYNTQDSLIAYYNYVLASDSFRAPIFYDSNNTAFYMDPASTSITNTMRANQFQIDGSTYIIDSPSGQFGSIRVDGALGGYAGYAIRDDWVFMADGATNAGIYNDTDNGWAIQFTRNAGTDLLFNGVKQAETENGYFLATNQMRAPIYYAPSSTSYWLDLDVGNTTDALRIPGRINRQGFAAGNGASNIFLTAQDSNHFIWNTATNWGIFWATATDAAYRYAPFGDNMITFVGAGNTRAAIDLDNGNAYFQGEVTAANFNINGGNEDLGILKTYGSGLADTMLFDGTEYWEKRVIQNMQGVENNATTVTAEYVKNTDGPFASSYVLRTNQYRDFDSDYIPVEPGEEIYGEIAVRYISGSGSLLYMGVRRYDKDKNPIATNDGIEYFVVSAANVTATGWTTYSGHTTIPTTHTPFNGSDGGACKYVRVIVLMNYSSAGALREFGPPILKRTNHLSNIVTQNIVAEGNISASGTVTATQFIDSNNAAFYVDPASISIMNDVRASIFYDRDNTTYYLDPASTAQSLRVRGEIQNPSVWINDGDNVNAYNENIRLFNASNGVSVIAFSATGTSGTPVTSILGYSDRLETRYGDNWQVRIYNNQVDIVDDIRATIFYDRNNTGYYADPTSTSIFNALTLRTGGLRMERAYGNNSIWFNGGTDANHVLWNDWFGGPTTRTGTPSGRDGIKWNTYGGIEIRGGSSGAFNIIRAINSSGPANDHTVELYANNVKQFETENGYALATNQMRAPIYYDSDNAAFYGDFASTSIMNVVRVNQLQIDGSTYIIDSPSGDYGSIRVDGALGGWAGYVIRDDWAFMSSGAGNAGIYNDTNNQWAILAAQQSDVQIYFNGTWEERSRSGFMEARGSYRAPIFYDSNNTAYLIDGNGTSRLLTLQVDNVIQGSVNGYAETLLRTDNRIISPNEDPAGRLRFGFTAWNNNNAAPYADYLHLRSYTDASGGNDNLVSFLKNGFGMRIWQQTWNSATAYATFRNVALYNENPGASNDLYASIFYDSNNTAYRADLDGTTNLKYLKSNTDGSSSFTRALTIKDAGQAEINFGSYPGAWTSALQIQNNTNTDFVWISPLDDGQNARFRTGGSGLDIYTDGGVDTGTYSAFIGSGSVRSPIFYDLNNTVYYGDFAGTSIMNILDVRGEVYNDGWFRNDTSGRGLLNTATQMHWYSDTSSRWRLYSTSSTSQILFTTAGDAARGYVYADNGNSIGFLNNAGSWRMRIVSGDWIDVAGSSIRARIFYDNNDTSYYIDPNSGGRVLNLGIGLAASNGGKLSVTGGHGDSDIRLTAQGNQLGSGVTSSMHWWVSEPGVTWNEGGFGYNVNNDGGTPNGFGRPNTSYGQGYMRYTTGGNIIVYNTNTSGTRFQNMEFLSNGTVLANNYLTGGNSLRAPIFYDSNNTAYYFDGASINSTRFEGVNSRTMAMMGLSGQTRSSKELYAARPRNTSDADYWTGSMGWGTVDMNTVGDWGSGFIDSWSNPANQPSGTSHWVGTQAFHYTNGSTRYGWQLVGGPIGNLRFRQTWPGFGAWRTVPMLNVNDGNVGAMYANIYYDSDNTGFYMDPTAFTNLNTGVRATEIYARSWFRNDNVNTGLYNQATGAHWYSTSSQYWNATGNNNAADMNIRGLAAFQGTSRFWIHGATDGRQGFLNSNGSWLFRMSHNAGLSPGIWFYEAGESWTGNPGADVGKVEYHANRMYIVSGANSDRIVQFRRDGGDTSWIANDGVFVGTATSARWADLAERYEADAIYEAGTVLAIGGDKEVTLYQPGMPLAGAVSTKPAYRMNDEDYGNDNSLKSKMNPFVALKGRIPVKINGSAKKGQWIIADKDGKGRAVDYGTPSINTFDIIGIALENGENEVEVKI